MINITVAVENHFGNSFSQTHFGYFFPDQTGLFHFIAFRDLGNRLLQVAHRHLRVEPSHRVEQARAVQMARAGMPNARLGAAILARDARLGAAENALLEQAMERLNLSARGRDKVLRLARTIADLAGVEVIRVEHLAEAMGYRELQW